MSGSSLAGTGSNASITTNTPIVVPTVIASSSPAPATVPTAAVTAAAAPATPTVQPTSQAASSAAAAAYPIEKPAEADRFVDSIGVDTHFNYTGTPYVNGFPQVSSMLIASGIRHVRDGSASTASDYAARLTLLGQAGIKHSIGFTLGATASDVTEALAAQAPYVDFVEPGNEADNMGDANWVSDIKALTSVVYAGVKSSPQSASVTVLGPALATPSNYNLLGNIDQMTDAGNLHSTLCNLNPGSLSPAYLSIATNTSLIDSSTTHPIWTTETGYNSDMTRSCAIPNDVTARYDPRTVAERFLAGEPRIYFYQFSDDPTDPVFGGMGLIDASGNAKPQYTAMKNMIQLLSDRGADFTPTPLSYQISGATQNVHHLLLQKRDGTYVLMLWLEVPRWQSISADNLGGVAVPVSPQGITISTARTNLLATQYQYDPTTWSIVPTGLAPATNSYSIAVSDSVSFVELK